jgi:hypothetical protein
MASFREDSVQSNIQTSPDPRPEKPDLNDVTASEALGYYSAPLYDFEKSPYKLWTEGNPVGKKPYVAFNLVPDRRYDRTLPGAGILFEQNAEGGSGVLSVGNPNLNYSRELVLPEGEIYDRIEGGIGPFGGYFMESQFPQGTGTEYGGSLNLGPFTLFGNRATTRQNVPEAFKQEETTFGAHGSGDVGIGTLYGGVEGMNRYQDPRITLLNLGLSGDNYNIGGGLTRFGRDRTESNLRGSYKWLDPLKLGGEFGVNAGLSGDNFDIGGRYTLPLGG